MSKLLFSVIVETIVGISLAGLVLAIIVPALNRYRPDADSSAALVIVAVLVGVTAAVLFRPNSAIKRWMRR